MDSWVYYLMGFDSRITHGGFKRCQQIKSIIERSVPHVTETMYQIKREGSFNLIVFMKMMVVALIGRVPLNDLIKCALFFSFLDVKFSKNQPRVIVSDYVNSISKYIWIYCNHRKIKYVCSIHNIEYLIAGSVGSKEAIREFWSQNRSIHASNFVVSISQFDSYVSGIVGAKSVYLPFSSCSSDIKIAERISSLRKIQNKNKIKIKVLILGTVLNVPTRKGVANLLDNISTWCPENFLVKVAGYGTDLFFDSTERVEILGPLTEESLNKLLVEVDCCLIYQPPTSGFITKLDFLGRCGIPLFINKNYFYDSNQGFFFYDSLKELNALMSKTLKSESKIDSKKRLEINNEVEHFIFMLRELM
jgi:hypothetical protein